MKTALIFPGQGSQYIGMGQGLYNNFTEAKELFHEVDDTLNQHLSKLIFSGEQAELTLTHNAQPAIMATSLAALKVIEKQSSMNISQLCEYVCGHSLGEYSALAAGECMSIATTATLLKLRGNAMAKASNDYDCSMLALLGATIEQAESIVQAASKLGVCEIANDNGAGQVVISGLRSALNWVVANAAMFGVKRIIELNVSGAFHSQLMKDAAFTMKNALYNVDITVPKVNLIANYSASLISEPQAIKDSLVLQITNRVRWRETMEYLIKLGVKRFIEVGPGKVLSTITKRMDGNAIIYSVCNPYDVEQLLTNI